MIYHKSERNLTYFKNKIIMVKESKIPIKGVHNQDHLAEN